MPYSGIPGIDQIPGGLDESDLRIGFVKLTRESLVKFHYDATKVDIPVRRFTKSGSEQRLPHEKECNAIGMWLVASRGKTDNEGILNFVLNDYLGCENQPGVISPYHNAILGMPYVSASPITADPVFVTHEYEWEDREEEPWMQVDPGLSVEITIRSWNSDGDAARGVHVAWICVVNGWLHPYYIPG